MLLRQTWNSGTVERMSMMMEVTRKRELTMTSTLLQYSTVQCSTVQYSTAPHLGGAGGVRVLGEAPELGAELGAAHALGYSTVQ